LGFFGLAGIKCSEKLSDRLPADMRWRCCIARQPRHTVVQMTDPEVRSAMTVPNPF